ncbi:MAG: diguanylate cyclase [Deltaproteobacteria bacterium]|nr:diguanylate cyclase [Deltaproteobacteria bacterium]
MASKGVLKSREFGRKLDGLTREYGKQAYSELFRVLAHVDLKPAVAESHWREVVAHQKDMATRMGRPVDLRVAMLDHFLTIRRKLKNPTILEFRVYQATERSSIQDELTGLYNYRYFNNALDREFRRSTRYGGVLSVLIFDIDNFKLYNDQNGHVAGNAVLYKIAKIMKTKVRDVDTLARYGGEEFAIILPETTKQGAMMVAERIRHAIEAAAFPFSAKMPGGKLTVSGGLATSPFDARTATALLENADRALYLAKGEGKNCVRTFITETRSFTRVPAKVLGQFRLLSHHTGIIATKNLSKNGLLFESKAPMPIGSIIELGIRLTQRKSIRLKASVVRVESAGENRFDIGVIITRISAADRKALDHFIDSRVPDSE